MKKMQYVGVLLLLALMGCAKSAMPMGAKSAAGPRMDAQAPAAENGVMMAGGAAAMPGMHGAKEFGEAEPQAQDTMSRKIIYTAKVEVIVDDLDRAKEELMRLVGEQKGAYISQSDIAGRSGSPRSGTWTIRLPVAGFQAFVDAVASLGELKRNNIDSQDVTDEYYDLQARIKNKQVEESRLLKHLEESTGKLTDILAVEKELTRVRGEIERMQGRMQYLEKLSALTTVTVTIHERKGYVPPRVPTFGSEVDDTFKGSWEALLSVGKALVIVLVALTPWLPVLALLGGLIWWLVRRQLRRPRPLAPVFVAEPATPANPA